MVNDSFGSNRVLGWLWCLMWRSGDDCGLAGDTFDRCSWLWRLLLCLGCKWVHHLLPRLVLQIVDYVWYWCHDLVHLSGPQDVRYLYCLFYVIFVPLRWIYYRYKKWHYYLLVSCNSLEQFICLVREESQCCLDLKLVLKLQVELVMYLAVGNVHEHECWCSITVTTEVGQ